MSEKKDKMKVENFEIETLTDEDLEFTSGGGDNYGSGICDGDNYGSGICKSDGELDGDE